MVASLYTQRIDRVLDHIGRNLDGDLSLNSLAGVACFSPFHFHRIFHSITGETLNQHVRRVRLERAAALLKASPRARLTMVALQSGFAGLPEFSRAFKAQYGLNASKWNRKSALADATKASVSAFSNYSELQLENWLQRQQLRVAITYLPACRFVYTRVHNPYGNEQLVQTYYDLMAWLAAEGVAFEDTIIVGMSQDDPSVTPKEKCRYDLGAMFTSQTHPANLLADVVNERDGSLRPAPVAPSGFSVRDLPASKVAALRCRGDLAEADRVWQYLYRCWLPQSRYEPAELPAMEVFVRLPEQIGWSIFDLEACIPLADT